jgi:site-specific recombinase XerD
MPMKWNPDYSKWLSEHEIDTLQTYVDDRKNKSEVWKRYHLIVSLALQSGLRVSEMVNLKASFCCLDGNSFLRIFGKGKKWRNVIIPNTLKKLLSEHIKTNGLTENDYILTSSHTKPYSRQGLRYIFKTLCKQSLNKHHTIHHSRHSYATKLYKQTKDLRMIQIQLGHSSVNTTAIYSHVDSEQTMNALNNIFN